MRSEWILTTLDEVCAKITDGAHNSPKSVDIGMPMASVKDLTFFGVDLSRARLISIDEYDKLVKQGCRPEVKDVLIAKDGNSALDTVCVVNEPLDAVMLSSVAILRPDPTKIDSHYLKYYFSSKSIISYLKRNFISGAAIPRVVLRDFKKAEIRLPSVEIQRKISSILRSLDDKIELNSKMNETLEAMAQALFKSWFVDFDPVIAKAKAKSEQELEVFASTLDISKEILDLFPSEFEESEMGMIPLGWEVKPLDKVAHYQNGLALQKFRPKDEKYFLPVLKIAQLKKGYADGEEKADVNIKPECIVDDGDVIFSWSGSLVVDVWCGGKAALNQHLFKVTSKDYAKWFYYYWTKQHLDNFQRVAAAKAVTMGHIKRSHLAEALCVIPNDAVLNAAEQIINPLLEKLILNRLEKNNLQKTRDILLPKLFSGELDVSNIHIGLENEA